MNEIWREVKGHEAYCVSNLGNVCSMNYRGTEEKKILVPKKNNCGRLWVELNGKPLLIHRLVATAFIPNPDCLPEINHKDGNPGNNAVDNLEWCTGEYNKLVYFKSQRVEKPRRLTMKVNQIDLSGNVVKQWNNPLQIKKETGMNQWSITQCCDGKRKTAYGFRWQYAI